VEVFEPAREKAAIRALARWAGRFSPIVGIDTSAVEMGNMIEATPDGLTLDITGCGRLFRGERRLAALVESSIRKLGFRCRVGLGPTIGAAWAIARFKGLAPGVGREVLQSDQGAVGQADLSFAPPGRGESGGKETVPVQSHRHATQMHDALADLPIGALRLTVPTLEALSELGIETIGQILALPKNALPSRFGPLITTRLDQLMGRIHEAIDPVRTVVPLRVERLFDGPSTLREGVELAVRGLLTDLCERLERKEAGVVRLVAEFTRVGEDGRGTQILTEQAALSRPSRDPRHLWSLLYPKVERLHMGFGIEGVALIAGAERRLRRHHEGAGGTDRWVREPVRRQVGAAHPAG
jgi:protein ImuB